METYNKGERMINEGKLQQGDDEQDKNRDEDGDNVQECEDDSWPNRDDH